MKTLGIIPARYESSRFLGKALADVDGIPLIQRVYNQVSMSEYIDDCIVATDNEEIFNVCSSLAIPVEMTQHFHKSGIDRIAEVAKRHEDYEAVIYIHCDEPFIMPAQVDLLVRGLMQDERTEITTLAKAIKEQHQLLDPDIVKIVFGMNHEAIYLSRLPIPYFSQAPEEEWLMRHQYYKHIGLYGFKRDTLLTLGNINESALEQAENIEALRWIENDFNIKVIVTDIDSIEINTPEDLEKILG